MARPLFFSRVDRSVYQIWVFLFISEIIWELLGSQAWVTTSICRTITPTVFVYCSSSPGFLAGQMFTHEKRHLLRFPWKFGNPPGRCCQLAAGCNRGFRNYCNLYEFQSYLASISNLPCPPWGSGSPLQSVKAEIRAASFQGRCILSVVGTSDTRYRLD